MLFLLLDKKRVAVRDFRVASFLAIRKALVWAAGLLTVCHLISAVSLKTSCSSNLHSVFLDLLRGLLDGGLVSL